MATMQSSSSTSLRRKRQPTGPGQYISQSEAQYHEKRGKGVADQPFYMTFIKVGLTLALTCFVAHYLHSSWSFSTSDASGNEMLGRKFRGHLKGPKSIQDFEMPPAHNAEQDAFGIASLYNFDGILKSANDYGPVHSLMKKAASVRDEFAQIYGGQVPAQYLLANGLTTLGSDGNLKPKQLAKQIAVKSFLQQQQEFIIWVLGSSAAAGYGNYYQQSYPFTIERILEGTLAQMGIKLKVRNLAMNDLSQFPFTWCMSHFAAEKPDLIIWNFEKTSPAMLEAFLRNIASKWNHSDVFLMVRHWPEASAAHLDTIRYYLDAGSLMDAVLIHDDEAARPFLALGQSEQPDGFRDWHMFGAPGGSPDKIHPDFSVPQHELLGWLISMYLLSALELVAADHTVQDANVLPEPKEARLKLLPDPLHLDETKTWSRLLLATQNSKPLQCYTSFEYIARNLHMETIETAPNIPSNLHELIADGAIGQDFELILPKTAGWYHKGWVLDLDLASRRDKQRAKALNFLGFPDWKKAYYGIASSGPLKLFIPQNTRTEKAFATDFFPLLVICESDAPKTRQSCKLEKDVSVSIEGLLATTEVIEPVASDEKRTCVQVHIPEHAPLSKEQTSTDTTRYGLSIEIKVTNEKVSPANGACSIAHVIFQQ